MTASSSEPALSSGLIELSSGTIEALPRDPAMFRLRSSGQRIMFVGAAGDSGLRDSVREVFDSGPMRGVSLLEYELAGSPQDAVAAANEQIRLLKPLYNEGFGRFRNTELSLPKKGHRIRKAMNNP